MCARQSGTCVDVLPLYRCQDSLTIVSVLVSVKNLPQDPLSALRVLTESEHELERIRRDQVIAARAAGASWQQIGDALGVTRQSAWESFTAETRAALSAKVDANSTLAEADAIDLAVEEVRAVRRRRDSR
jgi:hypothetical protein